MIKNFKIKKICIKHRRARSFKNILSFKPISLLRYQMTRSQRTNHLKKIRMATRAQDSRYFSPHGQASCEAPDFDTQYPQQLFQVATLRRQHILR